MNEHREIRIEEILGRELLSGNNQPVGRIEEFRVQRAGKGYVVHHVVIGMAGLLERMNVAARLVVGVKTRRPRLARWDQIDFSEPSRPRLLVSIDELDEG